MNSLEQNSFSNTSLLDQKVLSNVAHLHPGYGNDLGLDYNTFSQLRKKTLIWKNTLLLSLPINPFFFLSVRLQSRIFLMIQQMFHDVVFGLSFTILHSQIMLLPCVPPNSIMNMPCQFQLRCLAVCSYLHLQCLSSVGKYAT